MWGLQAISDWAKSRTLQEQRRFLPVYDCRDELLQVIRENQVVVVVGETGSGKTTQVQCQGLTCMQRYCPVLHCVCLLSQHGERCGRCIVHQLCACTWCAEDCGDIATALYTIILLGGIACRDWSVSCYALASRPLLPNLKPIYCI